MKTRSINYISKKKALRFIFNSYAKLRFNYELQADFPDSGYYYSKLQRRMESAYNKAEQAWSTSPKLKAKFKHKLAVLEKQCQLTNYEYYEKIMVVDREGRGWTAYEIDAQFAHI